MEEWAQTLELWNCEGPFEAKIRPVHVQRFRKLRITKRESVLNFWNFPMDLGVPPLQVKNLTEPKP